MKISSIEWSDPVATVHYEPNRIEKFFGRKPKTRKFIDNGRNYRIDGLWKWFNPDGSVYGRFEELDNFINAESFKKHLTHENQNN